MKNLQTSTFAGSNFEILLPDFVGDQNDTLRGYAKVSIKNFEVKNLRTCPDVLSL